tara:strand:+ start:756 stop:977 length:222 start_codon:yes stop_codon:yes gene_type:complete
MNICGNFAKIMRASQPTELFFALSILLVVLALDLLVTWMSTGLGRAWAAWRLLPGLPMEAGELLLHPCCHPRG